MPRPLNNDLMQYDKVFEPIVFENRVYCGFNDTDKVACWDLQTGESLHTLDPGTNRARQYPAKHCSDIRC